MTEEINYSYDGGLYAEMVRNRTFGSGWEGVHDWFLVEDGNSSAAITVDKQTGPSEALKSSLRIDVKQAARTTRPASSMTAGGAIPCAPTPSTKGSFFAKADSADLGPVTVSLVNNLSGKTVATAQVSAVATDWKQYQFTLKTGAIEPSSLNHLSITVGHAGSLWLNLVSLFPPTDHDRVNGNRVDLMEKAGRHASGVPALSRRQLS